MLPIDVSSFTSYNALQINQYSNLKMQGRASKTLRVSENPKGLQPRNFMLSEY